MKSLLNRVTFVCAFVVSSLLTATVLAAPLRCDQVLVPRFTEAEIIKQSAPELKTRVLTKQKINDIPLVRTQIDLMKTRLLELKELTSALPRGRKTAVRESLKDLGQRLDKALSHEKYVKLSLDFVRISYEIDMAANPPDKDYFKKRTNDYDDQTYLNVKIPEQIQSNKAMLKSAGITNELLMLPMAQDLTENQIVTLMSQGIMPIGITLTPGGFADGRFMRIHFFYYHDLLHLHNFVYGLTRNGDPTKTPSENLKIFAERTAAINEKIAAVPDKNFRLQLRHYLFFVVHEISSAKYMILGGEKAPSADLVDFSFKDQQSPERVQRVQENGYSWEEVRAKFVKIAKSVGIDEAP
jgi:hypothetical protein